MDAELERFKSEISLSDLAQAMGYELDVRESSQNSKVLRAGGDKIVVTRDDDGHDVFFNVHDEVDAGSVIDFVQRRGGGNLGQVRKELRRWLPGAKRPSPKRPAREPDRPKPVNRDRAEIIRRWASLKPYTGRYLPEVRGIHPEVIHAFNVLEDERGNACVAHGHKGCVVGWEVKNQGFTGFSAGGEKNLSWAKLDDQDLTRVVITEAFVDAMSYAQLLHQPGAAYASLGGSLSAGQREQLARLLARGVPIVIATDADEAGDKLAAEISAMAPPGAVLIRERPHAGKDWNDTLKAEIKAQQAREERARQAELRRHRPGG